MFDVFHQSDTKYKNFFEQIPDPVLIIDPDTHLILDCNQAAVDRYGYTYDEFLSMTPLDLHTSLDLEDAKKNIEDNAHPGPHIYKHITNDGTLLDVETNTSFVNCGSKILQVSILRNITDRMKGAKALEKSEERFRKLFEQSNDAVIIHRNGKIIDVNQRACEMLGYTKDEMLTLSIPDLHPEEERDESWKRCGPDRTEDAVLFETQWMKSDGSLIDVEVGSNLMDKESRVFQGIGRDITKRKRAEKALRENEARFRGVFESTTNGVAVYEAADNGKNYIFVDLNHAVERIENIRKEDIIGKRITEAFPGVNEFGLLEVLQKVWQTGESKHFPTALYEDDRIKGWRDNYVHKLPSGEIVVVYSDETERKRNEERLRTSEERYRILSENVADGVLVLQDRLLVYANQAVSKIFGYNLEDLYKMDPSQLLRDSYREQFRDLLKVTLSGRRVDFFQQAPCICEDGSEIWVEQRNNLIEWKGRPAVLATIRDITEAKIREIEGEQEREDLRKENLKLKINAKDRYRFGDIIGKSPAMQEVYELILKCSASEANVVIYGESGTGKELIARTIHNMSECRDMPFVPVNCGAIPETLFESEFFGHRKGAFTGAVMDKHGFFDLARGGTLFLDEIGELPLNMQVKLLRAIDGGGYMPVGGNSLKEARFRILAATNRDLSEFVKKGLMREDFYYRIHIIPIHLPPLRKRKEDIPLLVDHFMKTGTEKNGASRIPAKIMEALSSYEWPGNIRELQNILNQYNTVKRIDFSGSPLAKRPLEPDCEIPIPANSETNLRKALDHFEKAFISKSLEKNCWHRGKTATYLGIPSRTLHRKMKKFRLMAS